MLGGDVPARCGWFDADEVLTLLRPQARGCGDPLTSVPTACLARGWVPAGTDQIGHPTWTLSGPRAPP
jgi:hypothetical protein